MCNSLLAVLCMYTYIFTMHPLKNFLSIEFSNYLFYLQLFLNPPMDQEFGNIIPGFLQPIWQFSMFVFQ